MHLAVLGATGGTGRHLVVRALALGYPVTAVVRDPARLAVEHDLLQIVPADVFDPTSLTPALAGADAVLSALGPRQGAADFTVCSRATPSILQAMEAARLRRIVVISAAPVPKHDPADGALWRALVRPLLHRIFGRRYADLALMEEQLRESSAEWTVFRPPLLTNGPARGRYRTTLGRNASGGFGRVSRADLADAMLRCLQDDATVRATVGIAG